MKIKNSNCNYFKVLSLQMGFPVVDRSRQSFNEKTTKYFTALIYKIKVEIIREKHYLH